uniref:Uncharacterized protein n=1 Tax=Naja naja TaxID=35670 RepID=A0A8C6VAX8_NAJNA
TVLDGRQVGSNCFFLDGLIGVTLDISRVGKDRDPSIKDAYKMQIGTENESADLNVLDTLQTVCLNLGHFRRRGFQCLEFPSQHG